MNIRITKLEKWKNIFRDIRLCHCPYLDHNYQNKAMAKQYKLTFNDGVFVYGRESSVNLK